MVYGQYELRVRKNRRRRPGISPSPDLRVQIVRIHISDHKPIPARPSPPTSHRERPSLMIRRVALVVLLALPAGSPAQTSWTWNVTNGNWNSPASNWTPNGPPASANTTQLTFADSGSGYTAIDDITGNFNVNRLTFNNTGTGTITLAGSGTNTLTLTGTNPTLDVTGNV